jgi:hypothetical protein
MERGCKLMVGLTRGSGILIIMKQTCPPDQDHHDEGLELTIEQRIDAP